ncbi:hypothetical protein ACFQJ7_08770 [Halovenus rubra]|uniref:Uncharacterized protein n=2 Tax=Halovenus rubra TaxID=869890 RepID=A0ACC7E1X5_9EURY|nr:hypothetical protein [Halovenus rubra]
MQRPLFSRSDWNRRWLYDSALALGTINALLIGSGVDDGLSGAGISPELSFAIALLSMVLCVVGAVALFRIPDSWMPARLPVLRATRSQFRLFKIPAAVVVPWFGAVALVTPVRNLFSLPVAVGVVLVVGNLTAVFSCYLLVSRQQRRHPSDDSQSV